VRNYINAKIEKSSKDSFIFGGSRVRLLARTPAILIEIICGLPHSHQEPEGRPRSLRSKSFLSHISLASGTIVEPASAAGRNDKGLGSPRYSTTLKLKLNSVALVREQIIPTERPPLVGEVSANFFCG
jgi:hypothetical protein